MGEQSCKKIPFFFLKEALKSEKLNSPIFNYINYEHGPYSKEMYEDVEYMEMLELVESKNKEIELHSDQTITNQQIFVLTDLGKKTAQHVYKFLKIAAPETTEILEKVVKQYKNLTNTQLKNMSHETEEYKQTKYAENIYSVKDNAVVEFEKTWEELEKIDEEVTDEIEELTLAFDDEFIDLLNQSFEELESPTFDNSNSLGDSNGI
ncbi:type II toxin-antitoxin system antitoxin SocA domain-containing protein [Thermosipho africanus]|uniref:type II toxin-antitoxin system antitoxin SocA domain-containing protein n=1 Tax=Thermosipho africanus TaxID=2421 RepID=UPI0002ED999A|nr:type II toxin-antitoxin system antitoxin SocA domain-containing protein [Thermosipho africanus]